MWHLNYYHKIMWEDLFNDIQTFKFVIPYFQREDWYLIVRNLKEIILNNISSKTLEITDGKIIGDVHIGENVTIGPFVVIEGPVYIGDNVEIGAHTHIRPGTIIGNNCVVGYTSGVKNTLMMDGSKISNHSFIGDSILGAKARIGAHTEVSNRRFDQKTISWNFSKGKVETKLDKLGAIIGEQSRLGGGTVTSPGTVIGKRTFIDSGVVVSGYIPSNKFVKNQKILDIRENSFQGELHQDSTLF